MKKGEKPDSHPDVVAKVQPGVVGLGHDSRHNGRTDGHTTGEIAFFRQYAHGQDLQQINQ